MPDQPTLDLSALPDGVSATFTWTCTYGCTVRTFDGVEQDHICVGEQVIGALAGDDVAWETVRRIAEGLKPLLNTRSHDVWVDGIRAGRAGELCYGVSEDAPKLAGSDIRLDVVEGTDLSALRFDLGGDR